uniref:Uncharacterized protein n=1 Tax=Glossina brevipalpis TaxID=37001 RepID=A0A1A9WL58_9MUSC
MKLLVRHSRGIQFLPSGNTAASDVRSLGFNDLLLSSQSTSGKRLLSLVGLLFSIALIRFGLLTLYSTGVTKIFEWNKQNWEKSNCYKRHCCRQKANQQALSFNVVIVKEREPWIKYVFKRRSLDIVKILK